VNDRFSDLTNEAEPLADRAADASRSAFVPRPRATDAVRAPQQRPDAVSLLDRARWSWDAAGGPALAARSPADIAQAADPVDVATGDVLLFQDDVSLPGVLPLVIGRAYRSSWRAGRWFGPSWASGGHDSSTGPSGHRVTTTSTVSRRAQVRSPLDGAGATRTPYGAHDPRKKRQPPRQAWLGVQRYSEFQQWLGRHVPHS
jgi:hypothetical protein